MSDLLNKASLVMIPSGYKEDVVYSAVPSDGSGDLSFTRASNGTRVNSAGLVEVCPWNLVEQSETLDNTAWTKQQSTVTANAITAPNGTATADFLVPNTNNDLHSIFQTSGITSGKYTISVYAKQGGYKNLLVWFDGHSGGIGVNLDTLAIFRNQNNDGYLIETLANGWYRISVTSTISTASLPNFYIYDNSSTPQISFAGNGTSGVYLWGAQMNYGALKPYFPTTDRLNVPRLTYQNGGGGCPSLLLEKQSTNYLFPSEDFSPWNTYLGASISANTTISPDGTQNADTLNFAAQDQSQVYSNQGNLTLTAHTVSVYAKSSTGKKFRIKIANQTTGGDNFSNDFTTTSEWQRFSFTFTCQVLHIAICNEFAGGTGTIQIYGAQLEASSYPTSYIPTTSASATRVADACFNTSATALIGQTEGTILLDCEILTTDTQDLLSIRPGGTSSLAIGTASNLILGYVIEGATVISMSFANYAINTRYKIALAYKSGECALYVNGTQADIDTTAFTFSTALSSLYLGQSQYFGKSSYENNEVVLFKTRLTNAELASLTTI